MDFSLRKEYIPLEKNKENCPGYNKPDVPWTVPVVPWAY